MECSCLLILHSDENIKDYLLQKQDKKTLKVLSLFY